MFVVLSYSYGYADSLLDTVLPKRTQTQKQLILHGNIESKVYHLPECKYYECKNCTRNFSSVQEAEREGYHACNICGGGNATLQQGGKGAKQSLRGNPNSKIVHGKSCKYYNAQNSSVAFSSKKEALKAGYALCTICNGE